MMEIKKKTKKKQATNNLKGILGGMVAFLIVTMSLFHIFFSPDSKEFISHKSNYKQIIKDRDTGAIRLIEEFNLKVIKNFKNDSLSALSGQLLTDYKNHYDSANDRLKAYTKKKHELMDKQSFRGRNSFHFWIFVFGLVAALLFFSCKSLYNDIVHGSTFKFQFLSLTGIAVSFFWIIHLVFLTQDDFSKNSYIVMILGCTVPATFFTYFLVKNYTYKDDIILKQLSLIDKIKTIHYPRVALKALYAERNDKAMLATDTVKENADAFDNDILTILKDV